MKNAILSHYVWFARASFSNIVRGFKSRIRSPRYAIALLLGVAYFFFIFVMPSLARSATHGPQRDSGIIELTRTIGPLAIALLIASWWIWRADRDAIALSPAEVALLVPAPLSRKQLIQFKLLRTQPRIMMSALFVSVLAHSYGLPMALRFLSEWILFTTLQLHRYGASLVHTSLTEHGRAAWRRAWAATVVFAAITVSVIVSIARFYYFDSPRHAFSLITLGDALSTAPARYALAPFHAIMAAMNAGSINQWASAFAIAVGIVALHYVWVIRTDASFEEGAAEAGVRRAAVVEAARAGKNPRAALRRNPGAAVRHSWFPLKAQGEPSVAILWKNVLAVTRGISGRLFSTVVSIIIIALIFSTTPSPSGRPRPGFLMVGTIAMVYGGMITLIGPMRIRHDFRTDLRKLDLVRTLPIGGVRLAAAEVATSTLVLTLIQFALLAIGIAALGMSGKHLAHPWMAYLAIPAALALLLLNTTLLTLHNISAVLFPAWSKKPGGIEMFGMAMLTAIAGAIMLLLSLVGPALAGLGFIASTRFQFGTQAWMPGSAGFIAGLIVQLVLLLMWLGRAYDNMDPTEVTTP